MSAVPTAAPNLVQIRRWGLLGKWVKYNENFIYLFIPFFMNSSDPSTDFHDFQTTRTHAGMCLLGVSLTLLPILGVKSPENRNFLGENRRFQAKRAKY